MLADADVWSQDDESEDDVVFWDSEARERMFKWAINESKAGRSMTENRVVVPNKIILFFLFFNLEYLSQDACDPASLTNLHKKNGSEKITEPKHFSR